MNKINNINNINNNDSLFKYTCDDCNYKCKYNCEWIKHCSTELHKTGIRKKRSDKKSVLSCEKCPYNTKNIIMMKQHKLNEHSSKEQREKDFKFYCKYCDIGTFSKDIFEKHNMTNKHKNYFFATNKL